MQMRALQQMKCKIKKSVKESPVSLTDEDHSEDKENKEKDKEEATGGVYGNEPSALKEHDADVAAEAYSKRKEMSNIGIPIAMRT